MKIIWKTSKVITFFYFFISIFVNISLIIASYFVSSGIDFLFKNKIEESTFLKFIFILLIVLAIYLINTLFSYILNYLTLKVNILLFARIFKESTQKINNENSTNFNVESEQKIIANTWINGSMYLEYNFGGYTTILIEISKILTIVLFSILVHWSIIVILLIFSIISFLNTFIFKRKIENNMQKKKQVFVEATNKYLNLLDGYSILYYHNKENIIQKQMKDILEKQFLVNRNFSNLYEGALWINKSLMIILKTLTTILLFYFAFENKISITLLIFILSLFSHSEGVIKIWDSFKMLKNTKNIYSEIVDNKILPEIVELGEINKIEIKNLTFTYETNPEKHIFKNFSFTFEKGKKYAIVGASGSGKSTLIQLILGNIKNYSGDILINNINLRDIHNSKSIRKKISFLESQQFVFQENPYINVSSWEINDEKVINALKKANLFEEIKNNLKKENFDSTILSLGQQQRLALARTFYDPKDVLILDEGFANLDKNNALKILNNIIKTKNQIFISITHHLDEENQIFYDEFLDLNNIK